MLDSTTLSNQLSTKSKVNHQRKNLSDSTNSLTFLLSPDLQLAMSLAQEWGASSWLSTLPISEHGFKLNKGAFRDALALHYGWQPSNLPSSCVCGAHFSVEHTLTKGGFPTLGHNEVRDIAAQLLSEVCTEVRIEPRLQPLSGEQLHLDSANREDNARLDISENGFWGG